MLLSPRLRSSIGTVFLLGVVVAIAMAHAQVYRQFLSDDALISFRYASRLVNGHGLTWTDGERVEGYTDFLWVLLVAAGGCIRGAYITTALALDHAGVIVAVAAVGVSPKDGHLSRARLLSGGALLAASTPMAVWANGGLEHGFMAGILAVGLLVVLRRTGGHGPPAFVAGLPFAALALLRADGILLGALVCAAGVVTDLVSLPGGLAGAQRRFTASVIRWLPVGLPAVGAQVGQLIFRRLYYGEWQPNTALAKLAFNRDRLIGGLDYMRRGYAAIGILVGIAIAASILLWPRVRPTIVICLSVVIGWSAYVLAVGGDIFPGWRQLVFVLPPLAFLAAELGESLLVARRAVGFLVASLASLVVVSAHLYVQSFDSENRRAKLELWEWAGLPIGTLLKEAFGARRPLMAVDAAGALPYWSELPSLDMLGLNDSFIAHHPPKDFGHHEIGHELGDGAYVLSRAPDLVLFNNAAGYHEPRFLSGRQLLGNPTFRRQYQWTRLQAASGDGPVGEIWFRRSGGRLGVTVAGDHVEVPAYFLTGPLSAAVGRPGPDGRIVVTMSEKDYGVLPALDMPGGRWKMRLSPAAPPATAVGFKCDGRSMEPAGGDGMVIEVRNSTGVEVAIGPSLGSRGTVPAEMLTFDRTSDPPGFRCAARGHALELPLEAVSVPKPGNTWWAHPANFVFGTEGVRVAIASAHGASGVEISLDSNDEYHLVVMRGEGSTLFAANLPAVRNGGGLATRTLPFDREIELEPGDFIAVTPVHGDGRYSIGHLRLVQSVAEPNR